MAGTSLASGPNDQDLLAALKRGDEAAYCLLVERYHASLVRIATLFVRDSEIAEEVAQETWIAVLRGLHGFEGRSSLRTWLFSILANQAKRRGRRERRTVSFSALGRPPDGSGAPVVDPDRFWPPGDEWTGYWAAPPRDLIENPEAVLLDAGTASTATASTEMSAPKRNASRTRTITVIFLRRSSLFRNTPASTNATAGTRGCGRSLFRPARDMDVTPGATGGWSSTPRGGASSVIVTACTVGRWPQFMLGAP